MRLAIVKPDHLGDLILSSGAISVLLAHYPASTLFVSPRTMALARYLFPAADIRPVEFAHLAKVGGGPAAAMPAFDRFDQLVMLRNDQVIGPDWLKQHARWYIQAGDGHAVHQSVIDYTAVRCLTPPYDIDAAFFGTRAGAVIAKARRRPARIGLSIGSGFHANAWPLARWAELARLLVDEHDEVRVLGGPAETTMAGLIARAAGSPSNLSVFTGGAAFDEFVDAADELDLVIASDGGTAHLCSLVAPILSIFGPSPFRRYAPFGRLNRLVRRDLPCSPCCQYATHLVNGCLTMECMAGISAELIGWLAAHPPHPNASARIEALTGDVQLAVGTSHLDRAALLADYEDRAADAA